MKKVLLTALCAILVFVSSGVAQTSADVSADQKTRSKVEKYFESKTKVVVISTLGTKTKGQIIRVGADDFTIKESKGGNEAVYQFRSVKKVYKSGGLSTGSIIAIAAAGAAAAILLGVLGSYCSNEGGC